MRVSPRTGMRSAGRGLAATSTAVAINGAEGVLAARGKGAIVTGDVGGGDGRIGSGVAYGKQAGVEVVAVAVAVAVDVVVVVVVTVARSSRRATVAAMNFGFCPRTKAIYIRFVR